MTRSSAEAICGLGTSDESTIDKIYTSHLNSTVSLGKGFGSKGKQHHKHTASETQSPIQQYHQMKSTIMKCFQRSSDQPYIPASPSLTHVYLALHGNEVLSLTT